MRTARYVRFVIAERSPQTGYRLGLFNGVDDVRRQFSAEQEARFTAVRRWFGTNLSVPDRFARSSSPRAAGAALSWFKDSADEFISRMREMDAILRDHDVVTDMLWTERPGYIVYEDEFQIAAEPFADTPT